MIVQPTPIAQALKALQAEFVDDLTTDEYAAIVRLVLGALREPEPAAIAIFEEELDEAWGTHPDPSADEADKQAQAHLARRLALTYAWRRSIDRLRR